MLSESALSGRKYPRRLANIAFQNRDKTRDYLYFTTSWFVARCSDKIDLYKVVHNY